MDAYIVAGYRTAVGKAPRGLFKFMRPDDLGARVIERVLADVPNLDHERIDDVIVGNATPKQNKDSTSAAWSASWDSTPTRCLA